MNINEILANGTSIEKMSEIPLSENALYFVQYARKKDTKKIRRHGLYSVMCNIGVINHQFHFDVEDDYIDIVYVKIDGIDIKSL